MDILFNVVVGLAMGIVFGFALEKSRVFEPGMIVGQMQLRNFIMLKVFLSAVATGLVVLAVLNGFDVVKLSPKGTYFLANILGGLLFGAGMVIAGACPGTAAAQIGAGYRDAWAVLAGGIGGAMVYGYLEPTFEHTLLAGGPGKLTLDKVAGLPFWALALTVAFVLIGVLIALETWRPWRAELGANGDGLVDNAQTPPFAPGLRIPPT